MTDGARPPLEAVRWEDGRLFLLDQRRLPAEERYLAFDDAPATAAAIRDMVVRGAPAIGITAAYGAALAARQLADRADWRERLATELQTLREARPTAVNLHWALARVASVLSDCGDGTEAAEQAEAVAVAIHEEDRRQNHRLAALGAELVPADSVVFTHCNTGGLATGGHGTAMGVIRDAWAAGKLRQVIATETRPWLQGARLTAWELAREGIPVTLITDSAAAWYMKRLAPSWLIVGADRVTANGDVANKIGTYGLAVNARYHGVGTMVAAPVSTLDAETASGEAIAIEERDPSEVWSAIAPGPPPPGLDVANPAFDVTPAELVDALVTEAGVVRPPDMAGIRELLRKAREQA